MAVIPPPGKTGNRRPALRGVLMQDVSQGVERNRKWPEKRKAKLPDITKDQNEQFRQYQWATKYFAPELYKMWAESVKGTPLLPRDIMTMLMSGRLMAINLPDGRIMYPKVAAMDVSQSLDTISQEEGYILRRGPERWEGYNPVGVGAYDVIYSNPALSNPTASIVVPLGDYSDVVVIGRLVGCASSAFRGVQFSTDGGVSWGNTNADNVNIETAGTETGVFILMNHGTPTNLQRSFGGFAYGLKHPGIPKEVRQFTNVSPSRYFIKSYDPVTHLRICAQATSGGALVNMTAGEVYVMAR
jgi:hypothetical protein